MQWCVYFFNVFIGSFNLIHIEFGKACCVCQWLVAGHASVVCVCLFFQSDWLSFFSPVVFFCVCSSAVHQNISNCLATPSPFYYCVFLLGELGWGRVNGYNLSPSMSVQKILNFNASAQNLHVIKHVVQLNLFLRLLVMEGETHTKPELHPFECCTAPD